MPGLKDWFDVFRCGTHLDSQGRTVTITAEDIDRAISQYEEDSAPIVIGHPCTNSPAWGWIKSFRRLGDLVQARASSVVDEFAEAVKKGLYKNRSMSFNPDLTFRHVGFLGAALPAVKGLKKIQFSHTEDAMDINFNAESGLVPALPTEPPVTENESPQQPEALPEAALEDAPEDVPPEGITEANTEHARTETILNKDGAPPYESHEEQIKALKAELEQLKSNLLAMKIKAQRSEFAAFCDDLIGSGKLLQDKKDEVVGLMEQLSEWGNAEFADDQNAVLNNFKRLLNDILHPSVSFSETATAALAPAPRATDALQLSKIITDYMAAEKAKGHTVSPTEAAALVQKGQTHA